MKTLITKHLQFIKHGTTIEAPKSPQQPPLQKRQQSALTINNVKFRTSHAKNKTHFQKNIGIAINPPHYPNLLHYQLPVQKKRDRHSQIFTGHTTPLLLFKRGSGDARRWCCAWSTSCTSCRIHRQNRGYRCCRRCYRQMGTMDQMGGHRYYHQPGKKVQQGGAQGQMGEKGQQGQRGG
jgi:hypothetical protein